MRLAICLFFPLLHTGPHPVQSENVGWRAYFNEERCQLSTQPQPSHVLSFSGQSQPSDIASIFSSEFHDLPLTWESGAEVPSWLSGTYVRWDFELTVPIVTSPQEWSSPIELQWKPSTKVHLLARRVWKAPQLQVLRVKGGNTFVFVHHPTKTINLVTSGPVQRQDAGVAQLPGQR